MSTEDAAPPRPPASSKERGWPLGRWLAHVTSVELRAIDLRAIELDVRVTEPLRLRDPAGVMIRTLLARRLRDMRCRTSEPSCEGCEEKPLCDYYRVFEKAIGSHPTDPLPYWLQGIPVERDLPAGSHFTARVVLAHDAIGLAPYFDVALRDALRLLAPSGRSRFGSPLEIATTRAAALTPAVGHENATTWRIKAVSPLLLRGDDAAAARLCPAAPWLALLATAGARRIRTLLRSIAPAAAKTRPNLPSLVDIEVVRGAIEPWQGSRLDHQEGQRYPLKGFSGSAEVSGPSMPAIGALARLLAVTGVGKATTMGFGQLGVEPVK